MLSDAPRGVEAVIAHLAEALARGEGLACDLIGGGHLRLERAHPALFVCAAPEGAVGALRHLIAPQPAYLIASDHDDPQPLRRLIAALARACRARLGVACVIELGKRSVEALDADANAGAARHDLQPRCWVSVHGQAPGDDPGLATLCQALEAIEVDGQPTIVRLDRHPEAPPRLRPPGAALLWIRLELAPIWRSARADDPTRYPGVLDALRRALTPALRRGVAALVAARADQATEHLEPTCHPDTLGRKVLDPSTSEADATLAACQESFDLLVAINPVNLAACWDDFRARGFERAPRFRYRPLSVDPMLIKRRVMRAPVDAIDDPTLADLLRRKQLELDRQLTMLQDRGTPAFLHGSAQLHGLPDPSLVALAQTLLDQVEPCPPWDPGHEAHCDARSFYARAREAFAYYRLQHPDFPAEVELRDDVAAGVMVSRGQLLINDDFLIPMLRADALVEHEVGTHLVSWFNGGHQPLALLRAGLAGYEPLQEGLAVLAELLVGGLGRARMRVLAGRVVGAHAVARGADFIETFRLLRDAHGFAPYTAYTLTVRLLRGGGFLKDAAYLAGLRAIIAHVRDGGDLLPLYAGKFSLDDLPAVEELVRRELLLPPLVRPRILERADVAARLERIRDGLSLVALATDAAC